MVSRRKVLSRILSLGFVVATNSESALQHGHLGAQGERRTPYFADGAPSRQLVFKERGDDDLPTCEFWSFFGSYKIRCASGNFRTWFLRVLRTFLRCARGRDAPARLGRGEGAIANRGGRLDGRGETPRLARSWKSEAVIAAPSSTLSASRLDDASDRSPPLLAQVAEGRISYKTRRR